MAAPGRRFMNQAHDSGTDLRPQRQRKKCQVANRSLCLIRCNRKDGSEQAVLVPMPCHKMAPTLRTPSTDPRDNRGRSTVFFKAANALKSGDHARGPSHKHGSEIPSVQKSAPSTPYSPCHTKMLNKSPMRLHLRVFSARQRLVSALPFTSTQPHSRSCGTQAATNWRQRRHML